MRPQSLMYVACVLGIIFQQRVIRSHDALFSHILVSFKIKKIGLRRNFPGNLAGIYIKFDSSTPCATTKLNTKILIVCPHDQLQFVVIFHHFTNNITNYEPLRASLTSFLSRAPD